MEHVGRMKAVHVLEVVHMATVGPVIEAEHCVHVSICKKPTSHQGGVLELLPVMEGTGEAETGVG